MVPVNLKAKLALFSDHWQPRTIGKFNGHDLRLAKARGEFVWHKHDDTDDFFLVLEGTPAVAGSRTRARTAALRSRSARIEARPIFPVAPMIANMVFHTAAARAVKRHSAGRTRSVSTKVKLCPKISARRIRS